MKRFILCLIIAVTALCSCAPTLPGISGADTSLLEKPFSAIAEITCGSDACRAQVRRFTDGGWEFCVTEPFALEGLVMTLRDGETKLSMYELDGIADFSEDAVSAAKLISEALDAAKDGTVEKNGDTVTVTGESGSARYTITLDEDGAPKTLVINGKGVSVKISGYTELPIAEQEEDDWSVTVE